MATAFPSSLLGRVKRFRFELNELKASQESLFTRARQVVTLSGGTADRWEGMVEMPTIYGTELRTFWAWLHTVGLYGDFTFRNPDYTGPQSGQSSILVNGASQTGYALICDGATISVTTLYAGEYFQVGTEFHVMTADATANGSGQVTLNFKPAMRASPADNATVTLTNPEALLKLTSIASIETDELKMAAPQFSFEESL